jgi:methionyl-tRNA formyltransferase
MRILFMGTPDFAVPSLRALVEAGHTLCGAFTQPDKPKNRGMKLQPTPVKEYCLTNNIPVFQPEKLRDGTALEQIRALKPELIVVAAYGRILPEDILNEPPLGCINVHSSLLPRYRGAAPINWAVLNGDRETGVTIMHMAKELDAGDIIAQASTPIDPDETVETLHDRLALLGAQLLVETVEKIRAGTAARTPQDAAQVTYAPMLSRELSPMDWSKPARALHDQVRGLIPWPTAVAQLGGVRCKVFATAVCPETTSAAPGTVVQADKRGLKIACGGETILELREIQPDGKKRMAAAAFLQGHPIPEGTAL